MFEHHRTENIFHPKYFRHFYKQTIFRLLLTVPSLALAPFFLPGGELSGVNVENGGERGERRAPPLYYKSIEKYKSLNIF